LLAAAAALACCVAPIACANGHSFLSFLELLVNNNNNNNNNETCFKGLFVLRVEPMEGCMGAALEVASCFGCGPLVADVMRGVAKQAGEISGQRV
jgi:hypothetical protein